MQCVTCKQEIVRKDGHWESEATGSWCANEGWHKPTPPPAEGVTVWIGTDGQFHLANHAYWEAAVEHAEHLSESGLPAIGMDRNQFIERASEG